MAICEYCYSHETDYDGGSYQKEPEELSLVWLGIKKEDICGYCRWKIRMITEEISQGFNRPYDRNLSNAGVVVPYDKATADIKVIGMLAFLQDQLRELVNGRYFKKRWAHVKNTGHSMGKK